MVKRAILGFSAGIFAATLTTAAHAAKVSPSENQLANKLSSGSAAEVQMGNLARQKASNRAVREFGERMSREHTALLEQVRKWADKNDVAVTSDVKPEEKSHYQELSQLSGSEFDQKYMEMMLKDHQKDISEVQQFLEKKDDSSLRPVVKQALPILEDHIRIAENVAGQIGLSASAGLNQPSERPKSA